MTLEVVSAGGGHIDSPLPGAGIANPHCGSEPQPGADASENAQSIGLLITFGRFRFLDLGDLTTAKELELVCPNNLVGAVDVFLVSHHGLGSSNSKALLAALHPRVAILNNGARKGGDPEAWQRVRESPGLEDLWQLHYALAGGNDHNVADGLIANPEDQADAGFFIKLVAESDGSFTVSNSRNKFRKIYRK
jgi:competence protein ComEC